MVEDTDSLKVWGGFGLPTFFYLVRFSISLNGVATMV